MRKLTLDEFVGKYSAMTVLKENLRANLDAMTDLKTSEKNDLMRVNMIMCRQFAEDCGLDGYASEAEASPTGER